MSLSPGFIDEEDEMELSDVAEEGQWEEVQHVLINFVCSSQTGNHKAFQKELELLVVSDPVLEEAEFERTVMTGVMEDLRGLHAFLDESSWRYT
jgi:hypothetical protein